MVQSIGNAIRTVEFANFANPMARRLDGFVSDVTLKSIDTHLLLVVVCVIAICGDSRSESRILGCTEYDLSQARQVPYRPILALDCQCDSCLFIRMVPRIFSMQFFFVH